MSNFSLQVASWDVLKTPAQLVRTAVFIQEQNIPAELEMDAMDVQCVHVVAFDEQGQAVATGRLLPDAHIGRMAVLKDFRGQGLGAQVLSALCAAARQRGQLIVRLNAQVSADNFYSKLGFEREGEQFVEAGIVHITMFRNL